MGKETCSSLTKDEINGLMAAYIEDIDAKIAEIGAKVDGVADKIDLLISPQNT